MPYRFKQTKKKIECYKQLCVAYKGQDCQWWGIFASATVTGERKGN